MKDYRIIIKRKREKLGLSQYRLAKQIGVAQGFLSDVESGKKSPSLEMFFKICEGLEIKVFPDEEETE